MLLSNWLLGKGTAKSNFGDLVLTTSDVVFWGKLLIFLLFMQSALPQRGGEVNITLGGIDLNNSGRYKYDFC